MIPNNPFETYTHKDTGRKFRIIGITKNETPTWINNQAYFKWMVSCKFLDNEEPFKMFFDEHDKKYKEVLK